ncbi:MAG TPA: inositol monophosphatase family protein [Candidatus Limnocylindria bacterium]
MSRFDGDTALALAEAAARRVAPDLVRRFNAPAQHVATKTSADDLVSDADRESEQAIVAMIRAVRPDDAIESEEGFGGPGTSAVRWYVDPLDGTTNYLTGCPHWSIAIGCADEHGLLAGVVYDPIREELFRATRGGGAWLDDRRLAVRSTADPATAVLTTGFSYDAAQRVRHASAVSKLIGKIRDVRRLGSAALDLAWVAAGRLDGYFEGAAGGLDSASGVLLVREAGGIVGHYQGFRDDLPAIVAAPPALHAPLLALLREAGAVGAQSWWTALDGPRG